MKQSYKAAGVVTFFLFVLVGCKKDLTIPLPSNFVSGSAVYANDQTTASVLNGIYTRLTPVLSGNGGIGYLTGLYSDELQQAATDQTTQLFYSNTVDVGHGGVVWTSLYPAIGIANTTIAAMQSSSLPNKAQWLGEALFSRALCYSYLVNVYGNVALSITTDVAVNNSLVRIAPNAVYTQMIADLKQAQSLLNTNYVDYNGNTATDRARPNRAAATALLARVYLYTGDWAGAETQAAAVIGNSSYVLQAPGQVFLISSQENIWGLLPFGSSPYVADASAYLITPGTTPTTSGVKADLSPQLISSFEPNDARFTSWVGISTVGATNYYYVNKYKTKTGLTKPVETMPVLRLAEAYLIRAEARARQNNLSGAISDLNVIRMRAGLPNTTATAQADILTAIMKERRVELFTEMGHRYFDMKRTGIIDAVMGTVSPQKGSNWASYMQYWPIPTTELTANPTLTQTPGY